MPSAPAPAEREKSRPAISGTRVVSVPSALTKSGSTGPKLRSTTCSANTTAISSTKFSKASTLRKVTRPSCEAFAERQHAALVVQNRDDGQRDDVEGGGDEERVAQPDGLRDQPADDRPDRGADPLRGLHEPDRIGGLVPGRDVGSHGDREHAVAGEQSLDGTEGEYVPWLARERHERHHEDEARE